MPLNSLSPQFERLPYGILVVDENCNLKQINAEGTDLCLQLKKQYPEETPYACSPTDPIPGPIWTCCQRFLEICTNHPERMPTWQEVLTLETHNQLRICVNWMHFGDSRDLSMLVTIEDLSATAKRQAQCDALRYGLTQREEEYWSFVCQGLSRNEITKRMFITINTVKKHARNVRFKRLSAQ